MDTPESVEALVNACLERGILVTPEMLEQPEELRRLLRGEPDTNVTVIRNYTKAPRKRSVDDFVKYFNQRYKALSSILKARKELQSVTSISRVIGKKERENVALIGMVVEKRETKGKHIVVTIEDPTGKIDVWLNASNRELQQVAKEIVYDEVIGITGQTSDGRIFANSVVFPDVPLTKELKKGTKDRYVVFIGDVEVGSKLFMRDEFEKLIMWLSGKLGNKEQREIASKVGYVIFLGDLVHGVGIYPGQEEDTNIHDIKEQYREFTRYIKMIPDWMQVVLTTGNHDAGRLQEPQLPIYKDFAEELYTMPNVHVLSNPCYFTIDKQDGHPGFDILLYHGYSLPYYADNIQHIREAGGQKVSEEIMKIYLKKRHLSPTHGCNTYVPDHEEDPMVIDRVPDFLVTGHIHRIAYGTYNGVTLINAGCWTDVSDDQIKRGLIPQPGILPIVNLRTREIRMMRFKQEKKAEDTKGSEGAAA